MSCVDAVVVVVVVVVCLLKLSLRRRSGLSARVSAAVKRMKQTQNKLIQKKNTKRECVVSV